MTLGDPNADRPAVQLPQARTSVDTTVPLHCRSVPRLPPHHLHHRLRHRHPHHQCLQPVNTASTSSR